MEKPALPKGATPVAEMLDGLFTRMRGVEERFAVPAPIILHWGRAVGPILARRTEPVRFVGTTLQVATADAETERQLMALEATLMGQLSTLSGVTLSGMKVVRRRIQPAKHSQTATLGENPVNPPQVLPPFSELPLVPLGTPWEGDPPRSTPPK